MAYTANVLSVMIASPGDVIEERNLIRDVIHEWNDINSRITKCVLLPVGWETHSAPDLGGRAQEIINKSVEHCDLLVGVFWTRLGTPTGEFESGTVEEIKRHVSKRKPAMVYFSTAPVAPQSIDLEQYRALQDFRKWCLDQGLIESYDNIADFSDKFRRQLQMKIRDMPEFENSSTHEAADVFPGNSFFSEISVDERLSDESKRLLVEASKDKDGIVMNVRYLSGTAIQTNNINFADSKDRRSIARWEAALEQLVLEELVVARGYKGEIFEVTAKGYELADRLAQYVI
jgi:hypothetical protein